MRSCYYNQVGHVTAQFNPLKTAAVGDVITVGTFYVGTTLVPPATNPYADLFLGGYAGANIAGQGNLAKYSNLVGKISFKNSSGEKSNNLRWIKITDNIMVCDRNLLCSISRGQLETENLINGETQVTIDGIKYKVRLLSSSEYGTLFIPACGAASAANGMLDDIMHWQYCYSWTSYVTNYGYPMCIGYESADYYYPNPSYKSQISVGYRPALELIE